MEEKKLPPDDTAFTVPDSTENNKDKPNNNSLMKEQKEITDDFVDRTTILGLKYIFEKVFPGRIVWLVIFIVFSGLTAYQITNLFIRYFKYEVSTSLEIGYEELDFPSITICNLNPIRESQAHLDKELDDFFKQLKKHANENVETHKTENQRKKRNVAESLLHQPHQQHLKQLYQQFHQQNHQKQKQSSRRQRRRRRRQNEEEEEEIDNVINEDVDNVITEDVEYNLDEDHDDDGILDHMDNDYDEYLDEYLDFQMVSEEDDEDGEGETYKEVEPDETHGSVSPGIKSRVDFMKLLGHVSKEARQNMSHQKETMILSCSYGSTSCSSHNFIPIVSDDYNMCYKFNAYGGASNRARARPSMGTGPDYGLTLILYTENFDYVTGYTQTNGFRVDIHPFRTMSFPYTNGIFVAPGAETNIGLTLMEMKRLGGKYGECEDDETFRKDYDLFYTKSACDVVCFDLRVGKECGCRRPAYGQRYAREQQTLPICNRQNKTVKDCIKAIRDSDETAEKACHCKKACKLQEYSKEISAVKWPQVSLWNYLGSKICNQKTNNSLAQEDIELNCQLFDYISNITDEQEKLLTQRYFLDQNFALLKIYYLDWNYEKIEEKADYDEYQLLADIGGSGGVFLGISAFTGFEVLFYVFNLCVSCWKHKRSNRNT